MRNATQGNDLNSKKEHFIFNTVDQKQRIDCHTFYRLRTPNAISELSTS